MMKKKMFLRRGKKYLLVLTQLTLLLQSISYTLFRLCTLLLILWCTAVYLAEAAYSHSKGKMREKGLHIVQSYK